MKYIKTYEDLKQKYFWILPTDNRYIATLRKIGCKNDALYDINKDLKLSDYDKYISNPNNKYILVSYDGGPDNDWSWMPYNKIEFYLENGYEFLGMVEAEIVADKYNL